MDDAAQKPRTPKRRLSLTRADLQTSAGLELLEILQTIAGDGRLTRDEVEQLRVWLVANAAVSLPGRTHLQAVIDDVLADGVITEDEFEVLHEAVLRVLPVDLRSLATLRRRERRSQERLARQQARTLEHDQRRAEVERNRPLLRADFMVAGTRYGERQSACELCSEDDPVWLEREPDNAHDRNAVLVETVGGDALGYVPREEARDFAPILDGGSRQYFTVKKTLETARGQIIPVVRGAFYASDASLGYSTRGNIPANGKLILNPAPSILPSQIQATKGESVAPHVGAHAEQPVVPTAPSPRHGKTIWWVVAGLALLGGLLAALSQ